MEFLGDAILSSVISEWLFKKYPGHPEGVLTNLRSNLVRTTTLALISQELGVGEYLLMSKGEKDSHGQQNPSILADSLEAIIGAIFLDQGIAATKRFILEKFNTLLSQVTPQGEIKDAKSILQEKMQATVKETPIYKTLHEEGPDHNKEFTVGVFVQNKQLAQGIGKSKQAAEEAAARNATGSFLKDKNLLK